MVRPHCPSCRTRNTLAAFADAATHFQRRCNAADLLIACKQDPPVAEAAGSLLRIMTIGLYPIVAFESLKKYLQVQVVRTHTMPG